MVSPRPFMTIHDPSWPFQALPPFDPVPLSMPVMLKRGGMTRFATKVPTPACGVNSETKTPQQHDVPDAWGQVQQHVAMETGKTPRRQHQGLSPFIITVVYRSAQMTLPTWLWKTIVIVTGLVLLGKLTENHGLYHSTTMVFTIQYVFVPVNVPTNPRLFGVYPNPTAAIKLALCLIPQS